MGPKGNSQQSPGSPKDQPARGTPQPRGKIGAIVKSTQPYIWRLVPRSAKNGASLSIWRSRRRAPQSGFVNVRSGTRPCCNRVQSAGRTQKWRFCPSKKRHLAPFSATFSSIFPVFFQRVNSECRFGRELSPRNGARRFRARLPAGCRKRSNDRSAGANASLVRVPIHDIRQIRGDPIRIFGFANLVSHVTHARDGSFRAVGSQSPRTHRNA